MVNFLWFTHSWINNNNGPQDNPSITPANINNKISNILYGKL